MIHSVKKKNNINLSKLAVKMVKEKPTCMTLMKYQLNNTKMIPR